MICIAKRAIWLLAFTQVACTTVQEYPRCFLFRPPTDQEVTQLNERDRDLLTDVFSAEEAWAGRDSVYARASPQNQSNISEVWARSGCVNMRREPPFGSEIIDKWIVARCQEFLAEYVENNDRNEEERVPPTEIAARYDEFVCH